MSESFRMRVSIRTLAVAVAALLTIAVPASAQSVVSTPTDKTLYKTGPTGRYLMDGTWLFRLDNHQSGPQQLESGIAGWKQVTVPNAWNVGDDSAQSFLGGVGWYRKDFRLPDGRQAPVVGGALRVGQLPLEGLAQRQADRQEPRRLPALRDPPAGGPAQARWRQPPGHPGRLAPQADRLPAVRPVDRRASRRAAGGTTAACCARSTCARSTTSTSTRSWCGPTSRAPPARRRSPTASRCATTARAPERVAVSARFGARRISTRPGGDRRQALRHADQADQGRQAAPVVAGQPVPLRRVAGRPLGRATSCSATR